MDDLGNDLRNLKEELIKRAKSQAVTIVGAAKAEALKITKDAEAKIESYKKSSEEEAKIMIDSIKKRELTSAELESKKMLLEAKRNLIEESSALAKSKIEGIDGTTREDLINSIYQKASGEIDIAVVYCNKRDSKFVKGKTKIQEMEMLGGIIADNKDGTIRVDYSFETILDAIKESNLKGIAELLF